MSSLAAASTIPVTTAVMQENSRSSLRIRVIAAPLAHETSGPADREDRGGNRRDGDTSNLRHKLATFDLVPDRR